MHSALWVDHNILRKPERGKIYSGNACGAFLMVNRSLLMQTIKTRDCQQNSSSACARKYNTPCDSKSYKLSRTTGWPSASTNRRIKLRCFNEGEFSQSEKNPGIKGVIMNHLGSTVCAISLECTINPIISLVRNHYTTAVVNQDNKKELLVEILLGNARVRGENGPKQPSPTYINK